MKFISSTLDTAKAKVAQIVTLMVVGFVLMGCLTMLNGASLEDNDYLLLPAEEINDAKTSIWMDVVNTGNRLVAVGERGFIAYSDNNGSDWSQAEVPTSVTLTAVFFPTVQKGWAVGNQGVILYSSDGGETWKKQLDGLQASEGVIVQIKQTLKKLKAELSEAETEEQKNEIENEINDCDYFLNDWEDLSSEGPCVPFLDVWFRNDLEGIAVGGFGMIFQTMDGGAKWVPILDRIENVDGYHYYGISYSNGSLFLAGEYGTLFRSDNYAQSWKKLESPYEGSFFGINGNSNPMFVVVYGLAGSIYHSNDNGSIWLKSQHQNEASLAAGTVLSDDSIMLLSADGNLLLSQNNGGSFKKQGSRIIGGTSFAQAKDGSIIVVGIRGITKLKL